MSFRIREIRNESRYPCLTWCHRRERERRVSLSSQSRIKVLKSLSGSLGRPEQPRLFFSFWIQQTEISDYSLALAFVAKKKAMMPVWSSWRHSSVSSVRECSHDVVTKWPAPGAVEHVSVTGNSGPGMTQAPVKGSGQYMAVKYILFTYSYIYEKRIFNVTFSKPSKLDYHPDSRGHLLPLSDRHE